MLLRHCLLKRGLRCCLSCDIHQSSLFKHVSLWGSISPIGIRGKGRLCRLSCDELDRVRLLFQSVCRFCFMASWCQLGLTDVILWDGLLFYGLSRLMFYWRRFRWFLDLPMWVLGLQSSSERTWWSHWCALSDNVLIVFNIYIYKNSRLTYLIPYWNRFLLVSTLRFLNLSNLANSMSFWGFAWWSYSFSYVSI